MDEKLEWKYGRKIFNGNKELRDSVVVAILIIVYAVCSFAVVILF